MILRTRYGTELLAYLPDTQPRIPSEDQHIPLTFCVVVAQYRDQYVLVYNPERTQWEVPGGGINPGETPDSCARREMWEESSQELAELAFVALFKLRLGDGRFEYGAIYRGRVDQLLPFVPNEETDQLLLWDGKAPLEGNFSELSLAILDYVRAL
jgi:8-oxo-dGTP diphosphatase